MARVVWNEATAEDLECICESIEERASLETAIRVARNIYEVAEGLAEFAEAGSIVPDWDRLDIRERLVDNYRIIYQVEQDSVRLLTIIHAARQLPAEPPQ